MRSLKELIVKPGQSVLVRVDTDVALDGAKVLDDYRLKAAIPTIVHLRQVGATVILVGHLGRPNGKVKQSLSLAPVARRLARLLVPGGRVISHQAPRSASPIFASFWTLANGVTLLENLRFDRGEDENEPEFAALLAAGQSAFVNESFASAHRATASTVGVAEKIPAYAGLRFVDELAHLALLSQSPARPFTLIVGGVKVKEKLGLLKHFIKQVDYILTGGVVANMLLLASGVDVKDSVIEPELMSEARQLMASPMAKKIILPEDYIWRGNKIVDIGPLTAESYVTHLEKSETVFWAGTLGVAEEEKFAQGTLVVAEALAKHKGMRMIGGGDTATALAQFGLMAKMSFVSTGGGAALEYLAGHKLPALAVLE